MKLGILGHVGSGRSTVFDALTGNQGTPKTPGKLRLGIAPVYDKRVTTLSEICKPKKTIYAEFSLALPVNPSAAALDVKVIREMRDLAAYILVIGVFGETNPDERSLSELAGFNTELILADMERVETRTARLTKGGGARPGEKELLALVTNELEKEQPLRLSEWDESQRMMLNELGLLSHKPLLTAINLAEAGAGSQPSQELIECAKRLGSQLFQLCAPLESEILSLEPEAQKEFLSAYGLEQPATYRFVQTALQLLDQICFFTVGPDEVRAWNIPRGSTAPRAAHAIHSDLEKGFIRAEVVDYSTFVQIGSEAKCRAVGKLRVEGKDYIVQDGDIINIRFNI